ncbi:MAG: bifunctional aspartate kinase/homoserine dehydrogenase I [Balneolaceae bacterium]|nr:bifunctional aspartate kinase/homoserine dehydrogenase I [Balneolaceae bacterium]
MYVLKFGGTSVGTSESLQQVQKILQSHAAENTSQAVVVSALGGVTNQLVELALQAEAGNENYTKILSAIEERHLSVCEDLIPATNRSGTITTLKLLLNDLEDICRGVFLIQELSPRSSDNILSYGERLSSTLIHDYLTSTGLDVRLIDARKIIKTDAQFGNAVVDQELTYQNIKSAFEDYNGISIVPGFLASSNDGNLTTTLGRGGSDYSAALIAAALDAEKLQIWTDVSGMMTANPRMVPLAHPIQHLSYEEAMELSHFGAKVIYPPTIQPVLDKGIAVEVKNTFAPDDHGTLITKKGAEDSDLVKGLSSIEDVALCTLSGSGMVAVPNFSYRLFASLSHEGINVIMITQASSEHTITVGIAEHDAERARVAIEAEFEHEIRLRKVNPLTVETHLSIIALVGTRMREQVGVSANLFETLSHNGINVKAIAQGSTELNISVVIDRKHLKKSLNSLHESFFLSDIRKFYIFMIGVGNVGRAFLDQINTQNDFLSEAFKVQINVCGLANSRKMLFNEESIDLENWQQEIEKQGVKMTDQGFVDAMIAMNMRNSIFIDCTASNDIPNLYDQILRNSISVVTPNKVACSSNFDAYLDLKKTATRYQAKFLFETNVGAGLPVISTLSDLLKSGDRITKIQAVLSGTLNFLFNTYDGTQKFSDVVKQAKAEGYTEPDPRLDLSGVDVMRKILILARESGHKLELTDIGNEPFVPAECMDTESLDEFYNMLDKHDDVFKEMYKQAADAGKRIKYVATFESEGKSASTGLQSFGPDHPFYELDGKDNIVLFYTKRYSEQPLVVKGAGAGAAVTASGIFADIMRITSA